MFFTKAVFYKFLKFGIVGASGMVVDFSLTYFFKEIIKIQKYVANAIGFTVAATINYIFNRIWTFHSNDPQVTLQFFKFFFISVVGLGINTLILYILVSKYKKNFYLSKLFAIGVVLIWNFTINLLFTF
ncbi:MAG: GtrA family protein [Bacteroidales bacterium]|jgi:putative flippase GtrA